MQPGNVDQFEKVDKIFRRQLAVPLLDMENTFTEYSDWMSSVDIDSPKKIDPNVERQFKTALAMLAKREGFENELASCEGEEEKVSYPFFIFVNLLFCSLFHASLSISLTTFFCLTVIKILLILVNQIFTFAILKMLQ
jgi:hypothetical protein